MRGFQGVFNSPSMDQRANRPHWLKGSSRDSPISVVLSSEDLTEYIPIDGPWHDVLDDNTSR